MSPRIRAASHAGSWYTDDGDELNRSLSSWLGKVSADKVPEPAGVADADADGGAATSSVDLPIKGCRAIIAPHAGYSYSGPAAAWAYACIDTTGIERVFVLGPSHHVYLDGCALSKCDEYETPVGNLVIDKDLTAELAATNEFSTMSQSVDEDEHSLEMHLPYVRKVFEGRDIKIVPILIGAISTQKEDHYGRLLAPYLEDPRNLFVVSSDFCHWGSRFSYTYYRPSTEAGATSLNSRSPTSSYAATPIHSSIRSLDNEGIMAITHPHTASDDDGGAAASQKTAREARDAFAAYIKSTKNTVCGRHPIGVLLSALAELEASKAVKTECRFTRYEQSSQCLTPKDSSVSYASAFVRFL